MHKHTTAEFAAMLEEQLDFLVASAESFDRGFVGEAKRLAATVRVLAHDTSKSISLMKHLDLKGDHKFLDTAAPFDPKTQIGHSALVQLALMTDGPAKPIAMLDDGPFANHLPFEGWWSGLAFVDRAGNEFSRKDIVLTLANKLGGAHVDDKLDEAFHKLQTVGLEWGTIDDSGRSVPIEDQVPASMRQIAHELIKSLRPKYVCDIRREGVAMYVGAPVHHQSGGNPSQVIFGGRVAPRSPAGAVAKVGRNERCPCGSGKKYKYCHGR